MTGIQHSVDKGIFFSFLDSRYSGDPVDREVILTAMKAANVNPKNPNVFRDVGTLNADKTRHAGQEMGGKLAADVNVRMTHLYEHWFGFQQAGHNAAGLFNWEDPHGIQGYNKDTTGWWSRWNGDAFNIFRLTIIRAIEVSLGLEVGEDPPGRRNWPIDFFWICGAPKFEGWVSWREYGDSGWVNVFMVTPSIGEDPKGNYNSGISLSLTPPAGTVSGGDDYELIDGPGGPYSRPVRTPQQTNGLWVIGHEFSLVEVQPGVFSSKPSPDDDWLVDEDDKGRTVSGWSSNIVTVQPAEVDGGMLMSGRSWR